MSKNLKILVTGASSGIGKAMGLELATHGNHHLFLLARRLNKLQELEGQITKLNPKTQVTLLPFDVNDPKLTDLLKEKCQEHIDVLINNAGLALGRDKVETSRFSDWEEMIQTNMVANFKLIHIILPWMMREKFGDIINLCSIAGHETYSGGAVYCATKHAVHAFTKVLREETCGKNIRVMQISPGMVETDFSKVRFGGDEKLASTVYAGMTPLTPEDMAQMMMFMLTRPRHVVIDEIITMPTDQGSPTVVSRNRA